MIDGEMDSLDIWDFSLQEIKDYFKNDNLEIEKKFSVNLNNLDYF